MYNFDFLNSEYQTGMLAGLFMVPNLVKAPLRILHLGTGAGTLPMFIMSQLGERIEQLVTIDINEGILKVA